MQLPEQDQAELDDLFNRLSEALNETDSLREGLAIIRLYLDELEEWGKTHNYYEVVVEDE